VLEARLADYRTIHFATHAFVDTRQPRLSGLVLSLVDEDGSVQDGIVRLHEIYRLKLAAELVVLSACHSGLGKQIQGEGLIGLTRGFLYAGAARVVASFWKVDDEATAALMREFHRGMSSNRLRPSAALRQAQIALRQTKLWRDPFYWAAFVLQGEPN
jgi:CHAT domain-containing protein